MKIVNQVFSRRCQVRPVTYRRLASTGESLKRTLLYDLHRELGGKMVPFAGYEMPVQYPDGIIKSHLHTREAASLFDVSHMGQLKFTGTDRAEFLERVTVCDTQALKPFQGCYSVIPNEQGGIIDDTIVTNAGDFFYVVVNAACKDKDLKHFEQQINLFTRRGKDVQMEIWENRSLIALQGPKAENVLQRFVSMPIQDLKFFTGGWFRIKTAQCYVQRSGYTGEDGFEISVPDSHIEEIARALLAETEVEAAGLGARDSLRLEAGLSLYGHELDDTTTPKQAAIQWTISKRRAAEGGFMGDDIILPELNKKLAELPRRRVGLLVENAPAREGTTIHDASTEEQIGIVTSGTMSPVLKRPIAMGYVKGTYKLDDKVKVNVRGKMRDATISKVPFVPTKYKT